MKRKERDGVSREERDKEQKGRKDKGWEKV